MENSADSVSVDRQAIGQGGGIYNHTSGVGNQVNAVRQSDGSAVQLGRKSDDVHTKIVSRVKNGLTQRTCAAVGVGGDKKRTINSDRISSIRRTARRRNNDGDDIGSNVQCDIAAGCS